MTSKKSQAEEESVSEEHSIKKKSAIRSRNRKKPKIVRNLGWVSISVVLLKGRFHLPGWDITNRPWNRASVLKLTTKRPSSLMRMLVGNREPASKKQLASVFHLQVTKKSQSCETLDPLSSTLAMSHFWVGPLVLFGLTPDSSQTRIYTARPWVFRMWCSFQNIEGTALQSHAFTCYHGPTQLL